MSDPAPNPARTDARQFKPVSDALNRIILGKADEIRLCLACLLAGGHLLIDDVPGVGKTTLAHALARVLGLRFQRIQFTSDLLPADITGAAIYRQTSGKFEFQPGPLFAELVLADEINRASPKTQSALLEAMEEHQVTVDGTTYRLPEPFFVLATRNPHQHAGTFPLPESQLDRFLMQVSLGYPDAAAERALLEGEDRRRMIDALQPVVNPAALQAAGAAVREVHAAGAVLDYVQALTQASRERSPQAMGLSPRGMLALLGAARAWAWLAGRDLVLPEDVQAVAPAVLDHRLPGLSAQELLSDVAVP